MAVCGQCTHFTTVPPMGPGAPPYECGIQFLHATWYDNEACEKFESSYSVGDGLSRYKRDSSKRITTEEAEELFGGDSDERYNRSIWGAPTTMRGCMLSILLPLGICAMVGMLLLPLLSNEFDSTSGGCVGIFVGVCFLLAKNTIGKKR